MHIDAVYLWCNPTDPQFRENLQLRAGGEHTADALLPSRFADHDELRYSLRSLEQYAPWIRTVHIVTAGERPAWLNVNHPKVRMVSHRAIFPEPSHLPCFNAHAIEMHLHRIPELSEHFLAFNDDFFLGRPISSDEFFTPEGKPIVAFSENIAPNGDPIESDEGWVCAMKNTFSLLEQRFGKIDRRIPVHQARPIRRDLYARFCEEFPEAVRRTSANALRSCTDISPSWIAFPHYALHMNEAVIGDVDNLWLGVGDDETLLADHLRLLAEKRPTLFCLNDQTAANAEASWRLAITALEAYFPKPSTFEVATGA